MNATEEKLSSVAFFIFISVQNEVIFRTVLECIFLTSAGTAVDTLKNRVIYDKRVVAA